MKKLFSFSFFLLSIFLFSQENYTNNDSSLDKCKCIRCGINIPNCVFTSDSECNYYIIDKSGRRKKGTHYYAVAPTINLIPNPIVDHVTISLDLNGIENIYMTNLFISDFNNNVVIEDFFDPCTSKTIDISNLLPGNYLLSIQLNQQIINSNILTEQFIKL